jgi:hypothetical protein
MSCRSTALELIAYNTSRTWLQIDANVLHDGDVQLVEDAHDDAFAAGGADGIVVRLGVDLCPILQNLFILELNKLERLPLACLNNQVKCLRVRPDSS